jgi:sec-independent protein translocase protein TatC
MPLDQVDVDAMEDRESAEMTFIDHIDALRKHLMRSVLVLFICGVGAFIAKDFVFDGIIFAPTRDDFPTYRALCWLSQTLGLGDAICMEFNTPFTLINTEMSGQFTMHIQVSVVIGFILAFPYMFWEIWRFIKPGLHRKEVKYTQGIIFFTSMLFLMGVAFGYYVLTPFSVNFFATYQVSEAVANTFTLTSYISFITMFTLLSGIIFELPIAVYFLSKLGLLTPQFMRQYRRHAILVILIVSAIITPADVASQVLVFIPVMFLYEISIFISARVVKGMEE